MEITLEEETQLHSLSDDELAAIIAIVEAAEAADGTGQLFSPSLQAVNNECIEFIGPPTIVQKLHGRIRQLLSKQDPLE